MDRADQELLNRIVPENPNLKKLVERHKKLEKEVQQVTRYAQYSSSAQLRQKELKKEKLRGKELIMSILNKHRADMLS